jgi:phosphohistidine phosphatase
MELYLLRHGIAEDRAASGRDADRALTEEGRRKLEKVLRRARKAGVEPALILSSPLRRAMETAQMAAGELGCKSAIVRCDALLPDSTPRQAWSEIRAHGDEPSLLLTGHEPLFSQTAAWLLGSTRAMIDFRKGALLCIDCAPAGAEPRGVLQWMLTPKVC